MVRWRERPGPRMAVFSSLSIAMPAALCLTFNLFASSQQSPVQPRFRTATNLVVIDAVVVDGRGRHVTDLTPADFEVVESGKPMEVRQAVYVEAGDRTAGAAAAPAIPAPGNTPVAPPRGAAPLSSRPTTAGARVIAIVVDDLGLSFESTHHVRRALTRFVDEQVGPGDLVAILRTSTGAGALQQFTTDRRLLQAAVERIRWTIFSRSGVSAFTPIAAPDALGDTSAAGSGSAEADDEDTMEGLRTSMLAAGSLGALEFVIRGVEPLPGRKSIVFVSEGMRLMDRPKGFTSAASGRVWRAFTRVMDRANRAGVVVYTMDARGLVSGGLTAEDNPQPGAPPVPGAPGSSGGSLAAAAQQAVLDAAAERRSFLLDSQEGLTYLADQTGGFAVLNTNDLTLGLRRVLDDLGGYYLVGYEGSPDTLRAWDPGRVKVRVKRDGLRVRARKGLFGPADTGREAESASADPLVAAAMSPFNASALDVRVTGLFGHEPGKGSFLRSLFFIDPAGVDFVRQADGQHVAQVTLALLMFGDDGRIVSQARRLVDLQLQPDTYRRARERGILYSARIPVKAAGGYQLRAAARDERTTALGSSSQFVEIPRVGKGRLALSSIVMRTAQAATADAPADPAGSVVEGLDDMVFGEPWVRIFRPGSDAIYSYEIYDGVSDGSITLTTVAALLRDGRTLYEGPVSPLRRAAAVKAVRVVPIAGRLSFSRATEPGTYTLRVTVSQVREGTVRRQQHQWATFEVR
jgi:VWFA-related protein